MARPARAESRPTQPVGVRGRRVGLFAGLGRHSDSAPPGSVYGRVTTSRPAAWPCSLTACAKPVSTSVKVRSTGISRSSASQSRAGHAGRMPYENDFIPRTGPGRRAAPAGRIARCAGQPTRVPAMLWSIGVAMGGTLAHLPGRVADVARSTIAVTPRGRNDPVSIGVSGVSAARSPHRTCPA